MKVRKLTHWLLFVMAVSGCGEKDSHVYETLPEALISPEGDSLRLDSIIYHPVRVDYQHNILPWYSRRIGESYDHVLRKVWLFWNNMEVDSNGMPYYMNHQVWDPAHDKRGLGGDQIMMALSSWDLYYNYTGDVEVLENMKYMADYYLSHSLSPPECQWPNLPFPYNMDVESGIYDGDMILGRDYLQPDKAGSFGYELVHLYKKTGNEKYLSAAIKIANTLASKVQPGNDDNSPWPFKVNAITGETGILIEKVVWYAGMDKDVNKSDPVHKKSSYTTNWTGTLNLFTELMDLNQGDSLAYRKAFDTCISWMKSYPANTNKWGPFFEDIPRWSDTQVNATTFAMYMIENSTLDQDWKKTVNSIFQWVHNELDNTEYIQFGVNPVDEQTAYRKPGNSHSARQASVELMYWEKSRDTTYITNAIRQLNWATYMVDHDGKNFYPTNAIWMTDGYGDYVRHYLRAMAAAPQLAPNENHLLRSSSIVRNIQYHPDLISYSLFDSIATNVFRLTIKPDAIKINGEVLKPSDEPSAVGWMWQSLHEGGILRINQNMGSQIEITLHH